MKRSSLTIFRRTLLILMACSMLLCFMGCQETPLEGLDSDTMNALDINTGDTTAEGTTEGTTAEETTEDKDPMADGKIRVLICSDTHYTYRKTWYGVDEDVRMKHWLNCVLEEHKKDPYDLIIIAGDTSLDHWGSGGSWLRDGRSTAKEFVEKYVSKLPKDVPTFVMTGNHEAFTEETWFELTGHHRKGSYAIGNNVFIMVDSFTNNLEPTKDYASSHFVSPIDVNYIQEQMDLYPYHNVFLISHYFNYTNQGDDFKDLLKNNERIICLFEAHKHTNEIIDMGPAYGNKILLRTGNFSYTGVDEGGNDAELEDIMSTFWGWRELEITENTAFSHYLVVESEASLHGRMKQIPRQIVNRQDFFLVH